MFFIFKINFEVISFKIPDLKVITTTINFKIFNINQETH